MRRFALGTLVALSLAVSANAQSPEDNLFLSDHGTRVAGFSSEFGSGWDAANLTPALSDFDPAGSVVRPLVWSSASMVEFPHWILFDFGAPKWITTLVFDNYLEEESDHPGISAREVQIWTGDTPDEMEQAFSFELARNERGQAVKIMPVESRYVKIVVLSNFGHPWYTELGATRAFDDGSRPDDLSARLAADGAAEIYGLYFDFGNARLRSESDTVLNEIAAYALAHPDECYALEGHTDSVGADTANMDLSLARAEAARTALIARSVDALRLSADGFGESRPVATNESAEGRAANRRVTLRIVPSA